MKPMNNKNKQSMTQPNNIRFITFLLIFQMLLINSITNSKIMREEMYRILWQVTKLKKNEGELADLVIAFLAIKDLIETIYSINQEIRAFIQIETF